MKLARRIADCERRWSANGGAGANIAASLLPGGGIVHLLIADDDRDAVEMLAELLRLLLPPPLEITLAYDGQEALAAATGLHTPDAVILDFEMPRMNGVKAALAIRSALGSRTPTIIVVTGYVGLAKLAEVSSAFDHILPKPVQINKLLDLLPTH